MLEMYNEITYYQNTKLAKLQNCELTLSETYSD